MHRSLVDALKWRYAVRKFNPAKTIPKTDLSYILETGNLMPTSYGLQPFRIIVITDHLAKQKLLKATYNQTHAIENSALIVLAARTDINETMISEYTARIEKTRGLTKGATDGLKKLIIDDLLSRSPEERLTWAQKQTYLALGGMIAAASELGIDNHCIEGFDPEIYNQILELTEKSLHATVLLALGYRAEESVPQNYVKVRVPLDEMIIQD